MNQALLLLSLPPLDVEGGREAAESLEAVSIGNGPEDGDQTVLNENGKEVKASSGDSLEVELQSPNVEFSLNVLNKNDDNEEEGKAKHSAAASLGVKQPRMKSSIPVKMKENFVFKDNMGTGSDQKHSGSQNCHDYKNNSSEPCLSTSSPEEANLGDGSGKGGVKSMDNDDNSCHDKWLSAPLTELKIVEHRDPENRRMTLEEPAKAATFPRTFVRKTASVNATRRGKKWAQKKHVGLTLSREELKATTWPLMTAEAEQRLAADDSDGVALASDDSEDVASASDNSKGLAVSSDDSKDAVVVGGIDPESPVDVEDFKEDCLDDLSISTQGGFYDEGVHEDDGTATHPFHPHHRRTLPIYSIQEIDAEAKEPSRLADHALSSVPEDGESEDEPDAPEVEEDHVCCLCDGSVATEDSDLLDEPVNDEENQAMCEEQASASLTANLSPTVDRNSTTQSSSLDFSSESSSWQSQSSSEVRSGRSKETPAVDRSCTTSSSSEGTSDISEVRSSSEATSDVSQLSPTVDRSCTTKSTPGCSSLNSAGTTADSQSVASAARFNVSSSDAVGVSSSDKESDISNSTSAESPLQARMGNSAVAGKLLAAAQSGLRWPTVDRNASTASSNQVFSQSSVGEKQSSASEGERSRGSGSKSGRGSNKVELVPKGGRGVEQLLDTYKPFHDKEVYSEYNTLHSFCFHFISFYVTHFNAFYCPWLTWLLVFTLSSTYCNSLVFITLKSVSCLVLR
jgi:hypothetical protein